MRHASTLSRIALAAAALCATLPASANYTTSAYAGAEALGRVQVNGQDRVNNATIDYQDRRNVVGMASSASAGNGLHVQAYDADAGSGSSAWALASAGGIHLTASGSGSASWPAASSASVLGRGIGSASGSYSDTLSFSAGALAAGTQVNVTYSVYVTGGFGWGGQGYAPSEGSGHGSLNSMSWSVLLGGSGDGSGSEVSAANGDVLYASYGRTGIQSITSTVLVGQGVSLFMSAMIGASNQAAVVCSGNCGPTLYAEGSAASLFGSTFA